jgi:hypothetical protein
MRLSIPSVRLDVLLAAGILAWAISGRLGAQSTVVSHSPITPEQREILSHMRIVYLDDGAGNQLKTIRVTGVNLQLVNGSGDTESQNGLGNLIVGYEEPGNAREPDNRTGSHCVVVGKRNNYSSYGEIVAGESNIIGAPYASVSGGRSNKSDGAWSLVGGGGFNLASGQEAAVYGGSFNAALSDGSVVLGGAGNQAVAAGAGGAGNAAVVVGGFDNSSEGQGSVVVGGRYNTTTANYSAIVAGTNNQCFGDASGGGSYCCITGGENNSTATTIAATVSGGANRSATGSDDWIAGSLFEDN